MRFALDCSSQYLLLRKSQGIEHCVEYLKDAKKTRRTTAPRPFPQSRFDLPHRAGLVYPNTIV